MTSQLSVDRDGEIAVVSLLAPTMPPALFAELGEVFASLSRDPALRAVILRGGGKVFSYGLDLPAAFATLRDIARLRLSLTPSTASTMRSCTS